MDTIPDYHAGDQGSIHCQGGLMLFSFFCPIFTHFWGLLNPKKGVTLPSYTYGTIDDEVIDMQYRPLCSLKLKNSFLTCDHDKLTILASCLHLLSFLAPNPPKKWQIIYGWPCFEIIMACYSLLILLFIYCAAGCMKVDSAQV